jgi:serine/threonine-protein kinase
LPSGKGILFTIKRHAWDHEPRVAVLELGTRKWHVLLEDAADARYVATGHLAFLRRGTLMVVPFDPDKLQLTGSPVPALANVAQALNTTNSARDTAAGQFSISASGSMAYASGGILPDQENSLVWVDYRGKAEPIVSFKAPFSSPLLSPDGQRIAYSSFGMEGHIWVHDLKRGTATKLTSEGVSQEKAWAPDGRRVVFDWLDTGVPNLYWQPVDGSSPMERLTQSDYMQWPGSWSPDGETLAFIQVGPDSGDDILFLHMPERRITPFLNSRFNERYAEFSPDGRWIAYGSDESGRQEVYVQPFRGPGGKWQISNEGGRDPLWSRNGKQLFYRWGDQVWVVDVQIGSDFSTSKPRLLFEQPGYARGSLVRTWDISPDGQRFLMVKQEERKSQPVTEMILVQNWFEELKRLVPTGKK